MYGEIITEYYMNLFCFGGVVEVLLLFVCLFVYFMFVCLLCLLCVFVWFGGVFLLVCWVFC